MELKNFIKKTLSDIIEGVSEAKSEITKGIIIPNTDDRPQTGFSYIQKIDFEVSVNVIEKEGSEAKLSVVAAVLGGHVKGDNSNTSGHSAKLNFTIPIQYFV
jgi:hypothetical protein